MDLTTLTDEEFAELDFAVTGERARRAKITSIPDTIAALNADYLGAEGVTEGEAWRPPTGAADAYHRLGYFGGDSVAAEASRTARGDGMNTTTNNGDD